MLEPSSSEEDNPDVQDEEEIEQKPSSGIPGTTTVDSISQSGHAQQFDRCFIANRGSPKYHRRPRPEAESTPSPRFDRKSETSYRRPTSGSSSSQRAPSPSPSLVSEREEAAEELRQKEEENRRRKMQLYVFVLRCIAYPFNAKQPTDMARRQLKVNKEQLKVIKERFNAFLNSETKVSTDAALQNAIKNYTEVFLKSDRLACMVDGGGCSANDFREVFRQSIERRLRNMPDLEGLPKETVIANWMSKFDQIYRGEEDQRKQSRYSNNSEVIMAKEQLYDMFQRILDIKKYEHQILHNDMQLDNGDEQASQVRRELDSRLQHAEQMSRARKYPKFVVKDMESLYVEELKSSINLLMANLESLPVAKGGADSKYSLHKLKRYSRNAQPNQLPGQIDPALDDNDPLSKSALQLNFTVDVHIYELKNAKTCLQKFSANRIIYCVMEVEGSKNDKQQTHFLDLNTPKWDVWGTFTTNQPLPTVKIRLFLENSKTLALNDELLSKLILEPRPMHPEWNNGAHRPRKMERVSRNIPENNVPILSCGVRMTKPDAMKQCGYLYAMGKTIWKKWKKRFFVLHKVSNYIFALCSYRPKKSEPQETLQLDNYVVDYTENVGEFQGGNCFFTIAKIGESVTFASEDEQERAAWIQAIFRATGQKDKPQAPKDTQLLPSLGASKQTTDKARKHGLDEFLQASPCKFDHALLFQTLQSLTLEYRLNDVYTSLGWFSPGQVFVLDEYCARYGVRGCWRHLCYLNDLLVKAENGVMIDPTLMHYSFAFCASHVHGNRPDGIGTITQVEQHKFQGIKQKLKDLLEYQITNFRYCFPFGRPEGALKATLSLLERVLMKDIVTPVPPEEVRATIKRCLEQAALINYTKISEFAKMEDTYGEDDQDPKKKLEDLIRLAELCIEVLQQNEEYHAEAFRTDHRKAFAWFSDLLVEHAEKFWQLFSVDMNDVLERQLPDTWDSFPLFQLLNDYLRMDENLAHGRFHNHIRDVFAPQVVRYVDLMESSIAQSIHKGFEKESWKPQKNGCATSEDMLWKLGALQMFIKDLHWPEEVFAEHLDHRLKLMAADMIEAAATRTHHSFEVTMKRGSKGTDFIVPTEVCVMMNSITDFKNCALKLCALESGVDMRQYHTKSDEYLEKVQSFMVNTVVDRLLGVMITTLQKLARYDEGSLLSSFLSLTKPVDELGREYVNFMRSNVEQIRHKIVDELYILGIYESWYTGQMKLMNDWLNERNNHNLHPYQLKCLGNMNRKCYNEYELQGVLETVLKCKDYESICKRLQLEEATHEMTMESSSSASNLLSSNPLSSTVNTTRKLLSMNGFTRGGGDSD